MQRLRIPALSALLATAGATPMVAASDLPPCEPALKATRLVGPVVFVQDCPFEGEVIVSFTVKANGRTTNIVVEAVRATTGNRTK